MPLQAVESGERVRLTRCSKLNYQLAKTQAAWR